MVAIAVLQVSQHPLVHFSESTPSQRLCAADGSESTLSGRRTPHPWTCQLGGVLAIEGHSAT